LEDLEKMMKNEYIKVLTYEAATKRNYYAEVGLPLCWIDSGKEKILTEFERLGLINEINFDEDNGCYDIKFNKRTLTIYRPIEVSSEEI
jgi:hypothetical protein